MCVIIYKPKGEKIPTKKLMKQCWSKNQDGAGFIFNRNNQADIKKGFMSFRALWKAYRNENPSRLDEFAIHFRYCTSGGISKHNTHPFPMSDKKGDLKELKYKTNYAFMHNGVFGNGENDLSDTMLFSLNTLAYLKEHLADNEVIEYIKKESESSRLLLFDKGRFIKIGEWKQENGLWFSNLRFKPVKIKHTKPYNPFDHYKNMYDNYEKRNNFNKFNQFNQFNHKNTENPTVTYPNIVNNKKCLECGNDLNNLHYFTHHHLSRLECSICGTLSCLTSQRIVWSYSDESHYYCQKLNSDDSPQTNEVKQLTYNTEHSTKKKSKLDSQIDYVFYLGDNWNYQDCVLCGKNNTLIFDDIIEMWFCCDCETYIKVSDKILNKNL